MNVKLFMVLSILFTTDVNRLLNKIKKLHNILKFLKPYSNLISHNIFQSDLYHVNNLILRFIPIASMFFLDLEHSLKQGSILKYN